MTEFAPIAAPAWLNTMWKPTRPFCLSRIEVTLTPGSVPSNPIRVQVVIAQDPSQGLGAGYFPVAEATVDFPDRRAVADAPWPFGPRIIPAGWWVAALHDQGSWVPWADEVPAKLSVQLHGTPL